MRLAAPTAFKGTRSPLEAARHMAAPGDRLLPLSDGGDGFLECLHWALGGRFRSLGAADPFGRVRPVPVLELPDGTLALECAKVIGLAGKNTVVRPWLQAFRWRVSNYNSQYIKTQIKATDDSGAKGYLFWNAANDYDTVLRAMADINGVKKIKNEEETK